MVEIAAFRLRVFHDVHVLYSNLVLGYVATLNGKTIKDATSIKSDESITQIDVMRR